VKDAAGAIEQGEQLSRQLTSGQLSMIAIGGAIGTGLFLGSGLAVHTAVIVSYLIGAVITLLFMGALSEMAVAHPTAGSFGVYAELYLNPWAGFTVRYTDWAAQCIAIGGEARLSRSIASGGFRTRPSGSGFWDSRLACSM
jgi:amino acid transporter, AAT family